MTLMRCTSSLAMAVALALGAGLAPALADDDPVAVASEPSPAAPSVSTIGVEAATYRVAPPDVVRLEVLDEAGLTGDYPVGADGSVMLPLLGRVEVAGLTAAEAGARIHDLLERDYLYQPRVNLTVKEFRSQKVEILGSVGRPGTYYLKGRTTILNLLAEAGGVLSGTSEVRRGQTIRVVRTRAADPAAAAAQAIRVDLFELLVEGRDEANVVLADGDLVYITRTEQIHVVGEVKRPGSYPYEEGMTVLKALGLAGGATNQASLRRIVVRRIQDGAELRVDAKPEDVLQAEDVVEVPLGFW